MSQSDEVVISGIGANLPKSTNVEVFKELLLKNENFLENRWREGQRGVTNLIGKIPNCELFDTAFFGIHRQQCVFMDPMQRLVLEGTFAALLDAGVNPADIRGKRVGVFTGSSIGENDSLFYESVASGFGITGHARSMMANRISYWLNLKGPSCAFDSNWLSGAEVLRIATDAIRNGSCEAAIVAVANLNLNPEITWQFSNFGLPSSDGVTRPFDENASGYGRSDGAVILFLQRSGDAKRIYASIVDVRTQYNGNRDGPFLDINLSSMTKFLTNVYAQCGVNPTDVQFVEAYGCSLKKVDEMEVQVLDEVFCKNRKDPLLVGSVKSNCGHSEACSSFTSLVKVLIAMEEGVIPANSNFSTPNKNIAAIVEGRMEILTENREWKPTLAAINCLGFSSSYGHILLKANPKVKKERTEALLPLLVAASTRTEQGIQDILTTITSKEKLDREYVALIQDVFAKPIQGHLYRGYTILDETSDDLRKDFEHYPGLKRPIWFVYSGMGSQWSKMANDLMVLPIFAKSIQQSHDVLVPKGLDLIKIITEDDPKMFDNILHSFIGIAAMQIALTDLLHALGIVPDGIIGHSVGELGCAYADGCLTAEQMILAAYSRGKASQEAELIDGMMAAVGIGYKQIKDKVPASIEVACHNGPDSSTISGPTADMEAFVKELQDKGTFARLVNVSNIAYHSCYIQPAGPLLLKYLKEVMPEPKPRSAKWISTSIPEEEWKNELAQTSSAEYHTNNLLSQVLFEEGSSHIPKEAIVIEVAPHGLLQAILKRSLKSDCTNVPLTQKGKKNGLHFLLGALGKLYVAGVDMSISAIYPPFEYPVGRGTASLATLAQWEHSDTWRTGIEDKLEFLANCIELTLSLEGEEYREFFGNKIEGSVVVPPSACLKMAYSILQQKITERLKEITFENVCFRRSLIIPKMGGVNISGMVQKGTGKFEFVCDDEIIFTGTVKVKAADSTDNLFITSTKVETNENSLVLTGQEVYNEFHHRGHNYSGSSKTIKSLNLSENGSIITSKWDDDMWLFLDSLFQQYLFHVGEGHQKTMSITNIQKVVVSMVDLPEESCDLPVEHHYSSGIITSQYAQICGVRAHIVDFPKKDLSKLLIEYVPLIGAVCHTREMIVNWSLHTIVEHYARSHLSVIEVETPFESFAEAIQNVLKKYQLITPNISSKKNLNAVVVSQTETTLLVYNNYINAKLEDILIASKGGVIALVRTNEDLLSHPKVAQLMQFTYKNEFYSLIRKAEIELPRVVEITANVFSSNDLERNNIPWVLDFNSALKSSSQICLVANSLPTEGAYNFSRALSQVSPNAKIRSVFVLDNRIPNFNVASKLYQNIFAQNLPLIVFKEGRIGMYLPVSVELKDYIHPTADALSNVVGLAQTDYIGFNAKDESFSNNPHIRNEIGNLDYCGVNSKGENVMGLAVFDKKQCKIVPDSVFQWVYPKFIPAEGAVSVPHAYAMAYYLLVHHGKLQNGDCVLIHAGCSPIGFAALSIAASFGCQLYTSVASDHQKRLLTRQFSNLNPKHIYSTNNTTFETKFMKATFGDGAQVVLNTLTGPALQASFRCTAEFGQFIHLGTLENDQWRSIGTFPFLRSVGFKNVTSDSIFSLSTEEKRAIHALVQKGIDDLYVRAMPVTLMNASQSIASVLSTIKDVRHTGKIIYKVSDNLSLEELKPKSNQYICNPKNSYLIIGGTSEMWIDVAEWLINRGATRIVISTDYKGQQNTINRRLTLLQSYANIDIIFVSNTMRTRESTIGLISEVCYVGPIGGVFLLPLRDNNKIQENKTVQFLDAALRTTAPKAFLINLMENAAAIAQNRLDAQLPIVNIQWDSTLNYGDALANLDDILKMHLNNVYLTNDKFSEVVHESTQMLFKKLDLILPNVMEDMVNEGIVVTTRPHFTQLPSLSSIIKEVPPVFIIPGISGKKILTEFSSQLYYPVHCAVIPPTRETIKDVARGLANAMEAILPSGPFNIIGISCGGPLALEITRFLENGGHKVQISLIDGAPETIQSSLELLGEGNGRDIEILSRIFSISDSEVVEKLVNLPSWEARVAYMIKQQDAQSGNEYAQEKLKTIRKYLDEVIAFTPDEERIKSSVFLFRPSGCNEYDNCGLSKYCQQNAEINIIDGNHRTMITDHRTTTIINDKVIC